MLHSENMSKSKGNFKTLRQAIAEFSADTPRFSLADARDGMDDANFIFETANAAILRLTKEISWMERVLDDELSLRNCPATTYADSISLNEMNRAVKMTEKNYSEYMFQEVLKSGFYDLQAARDLFVSMGMHRDLLRRFMDVQTRLIAPIGPRYAEYVWRELLKKDGYVIKAGWPEADPPNLTLKSGNKYLQDSIVSMRKILQKNNQNNQRVDLIFVKEEYDGWKEVYV